MVGERGVRVGGVRDAEVGFLGVCGMCGRARGMGMVCGEEGARRAGLGSGVTIYALRN